MVEIKVDNDKCTGCGTCVEVCPVEVFELKDEKSVPVKV
jgi:ferredoxin